MASTNLVKYITTEKDGQKTAFVVGARLDYNPSEKIERLDRNNIVLDAALSLTDRLVKTNSIYNYSAWFPWIEGKYPTEEVVFGSLMTLRHWVIDLRLETIYIHCDAGTHRSPTMMGFYLNALSKVFPKLEIINLNYNFDLIRIIPVMQGFIDREFAGTIEATL